MCDAQQAHTVISLTERLSIPRVFAECRAPAIRPPARTRYVAYANELECGPMRNVMAAQPSIGGALCKSSIIPFLVPRQKVWLTAAARVPCSHTANIGERKTWTQSEFCR